LATQASPDGDLRACQADAADQDVPDAAGLQILEDLHPELRTLGLLEPHPEHVAITVERDPERQVERAALH